MEAAIPDTERAALIAVYNARSNLTFHFANSWKNPPLEADGFSLKGTEGNWAGVTVSADHVTEILIDQVESDLMDNVIPPELENFPYLKVLSLGFRNGPGPIPVGLGNLAQLTTLQLVQLGSVAGPASAVPAQIGNLIQLTKLVLMGNFTSLPVEIGNLVNLESLSLHVTATNLPTAIGNLTNLQVLYLGGSFTTVPAALGNLGNLTSLTIHDTSLTTLPREIGHLTNLTELQLYNNKLTALPTEIGNLAKLKILTFYRNRITTLPPSIVNLSHLETLIMSSNAIVIDIPSPDDFSFPAFLYNLNISMDYNGFYTSNPQAKTMMDTYLPGWDNTQTMPPGDVKATFISSSKAKVSWLPIKYTTNSGGYRVYYRSSGGGSWIEAGITADKTVSSYTINGLSSTIPYFFTVRTETDGDYHNPNKILSGNSMMASAGGPVVVNTYALSVVSSLAYPQQVTCTPVDLMGSGNGIPPFTRVYQDATVVTLQALPSSSEGDFLKWIVNGSNYLTPKISITMNKNVSAKAYYGEDITPTRPIIWLDRSQINFGADTSGTVTGAQIFKIRNHGTGTLNWSVSSNQSWLQGTPDSGTGHGNVSVTVNPAGLSAGTYNGILSILDAGAANSPQSIGVTFKVYTAGHTASPFGEFSTPTGETVIYGSIPVTGWVLDDIAVQHVKIYWQSESSLIFIGSAVMIEGTRPDVENTFPDYPQNVSAGWGYMLLSNFLPNNGNGSFTLHAIATDSEGNETTLGTRTITCNNADAVKPFGAIDTPTQGDTISGSGYLNWGWALTPLPNSIPTDGSTIRVVVDGVNLGFPTYNIYRQDIAQLFPDYANKDGAVGYFYLNTTSYDEGLHTIQWTVTDSAGNQDGIGSRYFTITPNSYADITKNTTSANQLKDQTSLFNAHQIDALPLQPSAPIGVIKGFNTHSLITVITSPTEKYPKISITELERVVIQFPHNSKMVAGYSVVGKEFRSLPVGSTLDRKTGKFFWQPGPGFTGIYHFVFLEKSKEGRIGKRNIMIKIEPKF